MFLAKFTVTLIKEYCNLVIKNRVQNLDTLDNETYKEALTNTLKNCAKEDATEHGRLLVIKDILIDMTSEK